MKRGSIILETVRNHLKPTTFDLMAAELYKEEDSQVYNIGAFIIHTWLHVRHWSYSETARYRKRQPSKSRQADWVAQ